MYVVLGFEVFIQHVYDMYLRWFLSDIHDFETWDIELNILKIIYETWIVM